MLHFNYNGVSMCLTIHTKILISGHENCNTVPTWVFQSGVVAELLHSNHTADPMLYYRAQSWSYSGVNIRLKLTHVGTHSLYCCNFLQTLVWVLGPSTWITSSHNQKKLWWVHMFHGHLHIQGFGRTVMAPELVLYHTLWALGK